jgi:protein-tyrosine phosphatase
MNSDERITMNLNESSISQPMVKVLFVCMGNICRSPTAQGVLRKLLEGRTLAHEVLVDSAGTHDYHIGLPPDERAQRTAQRRGIDIGGLRARMVGRNDFVEFDYILAMDRDNYRLLESDCPGDQLHKLRLLLEYAPDLGFDEVPDPYYGGRGGFEQVMDLIQPACEGLLADIVRRLG